MLLLAHVKGLRTTLARQEHREWDYRLTRRLTGRSAAVVGAGSIGRAIAAMLRALGMDVTLVGRTAGKDPEFGTVRPSSALAYVAADVDHLILAAPLTSGTEGMVDAEVLAALGASGYLVNVGRGRLIVTEDLVAALRSEAIAGAALDVFDAEPLPDGSPLWGLPQVVVSPHMSGDYDGFADALVETFRRNLDLYLEGGELLNVVDLERGYVPRST